MIHEVWIASMETVYLPATARSSGKLSEMPGLILPYHDTSLFSDFLATKPNPNLAIQLMVKSRHQPELCELGAFLFIAYAWLGPVLRGRSLSSETLNFKSQTPNRET